MERGSTPHIHSKKQEGAQGPFLELQVCLLLYHEAGGTMMWWREEGGECICPPSLRPAQATLGNDPGPTHRELTITMAAIVWSASPLSQETPQATPRLSD